MKNRNKNILFKHLLVIAIAASVFIIGVSLSSQTETERTDKEAVTFFERIVQPGDTLWDIAEKYNRGDTDIRQYIREIIATNELQNASIYPGQSIRIPIYNQ